MAPGAPQTAGAQAGPAQLVPSTAGQPPEPAEADRPFAPVPGADAILEDDDDLTEERPRHPYTWLHLIVLAVVAFVLGFLIVLLLNKASDDGAATASNVTSAVLSPASAAAAAALVVPT